MIRFSWICLCCALLLMGCGGKERLVVYADPWIGSFAEAACTAFEEQEEVDIHLRLLSTEVIAQHLHFGNPIDIIITLDQDILEEKNLLEDLDTPIDLLPTNLALVEVKGDLNPGIPGAGGVMMEASDRPGRRTLEKWEAYAPGTLPKDSITIANFQSQAEYLLLNAWVKRGFVPDVMVRQHPEALQVIDLGPALPGGFQAYAAPGNNPEAGSRLLDFLRSEKCKTLLAGFQNIP